MALSTYRIGTPRQRGEGVRLGTVRFLPRGVPKKDYARLDYFDVWLPVLAPQHELLTWLKKGELTPQRKKQFFARYRSHLLKDTDTRQTLLLVARLGEETDLSVGCYCEDEADCHRSVLIEVLRRAARGRLG